MDGLRRIAWGGTLLAVSPLFFVLAFLPLLAGAALLVWGCHRAARRVEAFRVAQAAAVAFVPLGAVFYVLTVQAPLSPVTSIVFLGPATALATVFAAVGEGLVRLDGRRWSGAAQAAGWVAAVGAVGLGLAVLGDEGGLLPDSLEDLVFGLTFAATLSGVLGTAVAWQVCAHRRPPGVEAGTAPGPLPNLPSWDD